MVSIGRFASSLFALVLALALPQVAGAAGIYVQVGGSEGESMWIDQSELGCEVVGAEGQMDCDGGDFSGSMFDLGVDDLYLDPDPVVVAATSVVNNTAMVQNFIVAVLLPVPSITGPLTIQGSIDGSLTDATGDTATLSSAAGFPGVFNGLIDNGPVRSLLNHPFSITALNAFSSVDVGPASFGPEQLNMNVNSSIGIGLVFNLSPGDAASFTAVFVVEPVATPEPGAALLGAMGLLGLIAAGRRRNR